MSGSLDKMVQPDLPGYDSMMHEAYIKHELKEVSRFYIDLLNKGLPAIGRDEFIQQYIDSGLATKFYDRFANYYDRGYKK